MDGSEQDNALLQYLAERQAEMVRLLEQLVNIDSGSHDKTGVDAVGEVLTTFFRENDIAVRCIADKTYGEAIFASLAAQPKDVSQIVLLGHRDTVFRSGEAQRRPFRIEGDRAYGPGVADNKAGLVMNAFVLSAFKAPGRSPPALTALITGDEEIGSPFSRALIECQARTAQAVFNAEPSRSSQSVVVARKGGMFLRIKVTGRSAHAAAAHKEGVSAIEEIARKIVRLHALTDYPAGVTVNVGVVAGGEAVNTVAPSASCEVDVRYERAADRERMLSSIDAIVKERNVAGSASTLETIADFPPLEMTDLSRELLKVYQEAGRKLGLEIAGNAASGSADSAFTASQGCPTLCSTGPAGGNGHSEAEYVELSSLVPRAQVLALAVAQLSRRPLTAGADRRL